jgi:hypothetical protein
MLRLAPERRCQLPISSAGKNGEQAGRLITKLAVIKHLPLDQLGPRENDPRISTAASNVSQPENHRAGDPGGITLGTMPQDRSTSEKRLSLAETIDSKRGD